MSEEGVRNMSERIVKVLTGSMIAGAALFIHETETMADTPTPPDPSPPSQQEAVPVTQADRDAAAAFTSDGMMAYGMADLSDTVQAFARHRRAAEAETRGLRESARPFAEWSEDHGDVLWWRLPISEAPYVGSPLDLGRTMKVVVQIGREEHDLPFTNTGGWPFDEDDEADLWWSPIPQPTFARAALENRHG